MSKTDIPFFKPQIDEETIQQVADVLRSGWLTMGPKCAEFEQAFARYVGAEHAVFVNSCTAALHLCLAAIDLKPGDEVITSTLTFAATAEVIEYFDAKPVLVDCRPDTLCIDESRIEEKITPRTRAIIPVHYAGHPCEMDTILALAKRHGLHVFEDAAHCTPAFYKGKPVGTLGEATCFSFYANKCITTGEGGMITTADAALAEKARILRLHGLSKDAANRFGKHGSWRYDILLRGYKYNATDMAAVIGLGQLRQADAFWKGRQVVVKAYQNFFRDRQDILCLSELPEVQSSWHLFPIRLRHATEAQRDRAIERLKAEGVSTSVHYVPLQMHSYYAQKYGYRPEDFPEAKKVAEQLITLPVFPGLRVDAALRGVLEKVLDELG